MSATIIALIERGLENEKTASEYFMAYNKTLEKPSLKQLFVSITDQELEHKKQLQELLERTLTQEAFADNILASIEIKSFTEIISTEPNMPTTKILQLLMKYYAHTENIYKQLTLASLDSEIRLIFQKLAEGELKLKQWVQDRYDLETLSA